MAAEPSLCAVPAGLLFGGGNEESCKSNVYSNMLSKYDEGSSKMTNRGKMGGSDQPAIRE